MWSQGWVPLGRQGVDSRSSGLIPEAMVTVSDEFCTWAGEVAVRGGSKPLQRCVIQDTYVYRNKTFPLNPVCSTSIDVFQNRRNGPTDTEKTWLSQRPSVVSSSLTRFQLLNIHLIFFENVEKQITILVFLIIFLQQNYKNNVWNSEIFN